MTAYIKYCNYDVAVTKTITTCANHKPWMTAEVYGLLKTRDEALRSGDKAANTVNTFHTLLCVHNPKKDQ